MGSHPAAVHHLDRASAVSLNTCPHPPVVSEWLGSHYLIWTRFIYDILCFFLHKKAFFPSLHGRIMTNLIRKFHIHVISQQALLHQAHTCQELLELELGHWPLSWDSGFGGGVARLGARSPTPGSASLSWFAQSVPLSVRPAGLGDLCPVPCELPEPGTLTARPPHRATWPRPSWPDDSPAVGAHQGLPGWGKLFPPRGQVRITRTPESGQHPMWGSGPPDSGHQQSARRG